jgi:ABC-type transport system involved in multi-copper enzyme maturation permease subunit
MTKIIRENNLSFMTGALAFLIFSTYFISLILFGRPGVVEPFIIAGIGVLFCLVIVYFKKKYPVKKVAIAIGAGVGASLVVLVIVVLIGTSVISGLNPPPPAGSAPGPLEYDRSITLDAPRPASPTTVPNYRVVSVQKFSSGTGTALAVKDHIPSIAEAPDLAEKALAVYGGLPADAVLEKTEQVFMKKYNLKTGSVEEQYPQYTRVAYRQYVNGSPVMGSGIAVSLGEAGELLDISKDWSTLEYRGEIPVISADEAFEKLQARDLLEPVQSSLNGIHITRVQSGYHIETHYNNASVQTPAPDLCTPVWIFYGIKPEIIDDEPYPLLVNATRG